MRRQWCVLAFLTGFLHVFLYQAEAQPATGEIRGYFPQFVLGSGAQSTIVLVNPSANSPVQGTIEFFDRLGNHWPVVVDQVPYGNGEVPFELPADGTRFVAP
ncbi:MAG: hypothetical protein EHM18_19260, partial [Acidobacteria bacterium]